MPRRARQGAVAPARALLQLRQQCRELRDLVPAVPAVTGRHRSSVLAVVVAVVRAVVLVSYGQPYSPS
ncbi:hypothetical protein RKD18_006296 [Streptomyces phaeoluteigriseus]